MKLHFICIVVTTFNVVENSKPEKNNWSIDTLWKLNIEEKDAELQAPRQFTSEDWGSGLWNSLFGTRDSKNISGFRKSKLISPLAFDRISDTLGAINTVGQLIVNMTRGKDTLLAQENLSKMNVSHAILTITKNLLGKNVTKAIKPLEKREAEIEDQLSSERLLNIKLKINKSHTELEEDYIKHDINSVSIEAKEVENRCRTPSGSFGSCEDLSNCPGLLLDLTHLRESLCFKKNFLPGVCCPLTDIVSESTTTQIPLKVTTRQTLILKPTLPTSVLQATKGPMTPVLTINNQQSKPANSDVFVSEENCGQHEYSSGRIVGGAEAPSGQWPWMAAIFLSGIKRTEFWCGGSLIGDKYILTAAHCTRDSRQKPFAPSQFSVRLGDIDLVSEKEDAAPVTIKVKEVRSHPRFSRVGFYNDLAILVLEEKVRKNKFVIPICLPKPTLKKNHLPGKRASVVGWGTQFYGGKESQVQRQALIPIWRNEDCNRAYFQPITDNFLCAGYSEGGVDACQGDSGGGLFMEIEHQWTQIGIVSFGNKCGEPGYPGVYTRISEYIDWIKENTEI